MKKLLAALLLLPTLAFATDYGNLPLNTYSNYTVPAGSGTFTNQAEFTTEVVSGPATITINGGFYAQAGSGRGGGYHYEYNLVDVDNVSVTDVNGNAICQATESFVNTGRSAPFNQYSVWQCNAVNLPVGTYYVTFSGHIISQGNILATLGHGSVMFTAPIIPPPPRTEFQ